MAALRRQHRRHGGRQLAARMSPCRPCVVSPDPQRVHGLLEQQPDGSWKAIRVDVAVPVLHGKNGEDGTIQGLFEIAGIPYVGCGVLGSRCLHGQSGGQHPDGRFRRAPTASGPGPAPGRPADFDALAARVEAKLAYPIFVKPANAGSSVGISKAHSREELRRAVEVALAEDTKVVFEEFIDGQEVECAAIGNPETGVTVTHLPARFWPGPSSTPTTTNTKTVCPRF